MNRPFSRREKALLLILAFLLVVCAYYALVEKPVSDTLRASAQRLDASESALRAAEPRLERLREMRSALDSLDPASRTDVPDYDNAKNVVELLNRAMAMTDTYTLTFQPVVREGSIVRRTIQMDFRCDGYATGKRILKALLDSGFRCQVTDLRCACVTGWDIRREEVSVSATVTFYEFAGADEGAPSNG